MRTIFGASGRFTRNDVESVGERLSHYGEFQSLSSVAPRTLFGWRDTGQSTARERSLPVPLVCASWILNRDELASLVEPAANPSSLSDAELLWKLYRAMGPDAFGRVNGQFALALWDAQLNALVLAVDCWAGRPLCFSICGEGVVFAQEYKALLALPGVSADLDRSAVEYLQATKYLPLEGGLFADIHPVAPGSYVRVTADGYSQASYRPLAVDIDPRLTTEEHVDELRATLLVACRRLVQRFDSVGVALSGGIDSALTLGAIRAVAPDTAISTYTAGFDPNDPVFALARRTAEHFGTKHEEIVLQVDDLSALLPELVWTIEDPVAREEMLVYLELVRAAAKRVPILFYGHLSDVLFGGMPRHVLVRMASRVPMLKAALTDLYDYSQTGTTPRSLFGALLVRAYYRRPRIPPPRVLGVSSTATQKGLQLTGEQPLNAVLLDSLRYPCEIGAMARIHARFGVEYGSIFHDLDVARCAFRIPDRLKIHGRVRKYILRRAAEGLLPKDLTSRPKDLIRMPRNDRLRGALRSLTAEWLAPDVIGRRGLFEQEQVALLRRESESSGVPDDRFYQLWTALLTEIWMQTFVDGRGASVGEDPYLLSPGSLTDQPERPELA